MVGGGAEGDVKNGACLSKKYTAKGIICSEDEMKNTGREGKG